MGMRRFVCVVFFAAAVLSGPAFSATLSLPALVRGAPGDVVTLPLALDDGSGVLGHFVRFSYNSAVLEYVEVYHGALAESWGTPTINAGTVGSVSVAASSASALSGSGGRLLVLRLRIKPTAGLGQSASVFVSDAELNDVPIPVQDLPSSVVSVASVPTLQASDASAAAGASVLIPVSLSDAADVVGFSFTIHYDTSLLTYTSTATGTLTGGWTIQDNDKNTSGDVSVAGFHSAASTGSGTLAILTFQVAGGASVGQTSPLHVADYELNDGAITSTALDGTFTVATAGDPNLKWVDFSAGGFEDGTETNPYSTCLAAVNAVNAGGTVRIQPGETSEIIRITKALRLEAAGYTVRIGVSGPKGHAPSTPTANAMPDSDATPTRSWDTFLNALLSQLHITSARETQAKSTEEEAQAADPVAALVLPYDQNDDGLIRVEADAPIALRLLSDAPIATESIWADLTGLGDTEVIAQWRPIEPGDTRDLWVTLSPESAWPGNQSFTLMTGASTVAGDDVQSNPFPFVAGSDSPDTDSNPIPTRSPLLAHLSSESIQFLGTPYAIEPQTLFETPQTLTLPLPPCLSPDHAILYYYQPHGQHIGWHPAHNVKGFLAPTNAQLHLQASDTTLSVSTNHAAIVAIGSIEWKRLKESSQAMRGFNTGVGR
jgi:cohesin domain-containing protein